MFNDFERDRHIIVIEETTQQAHEPPNTFSRLTLAIRTDDRTGWTRAYTQSDVHAFFSDDPFVMIEALRGTGRGGFWSVTEPEEITLEIRNLEDERFIDSFAFTWNGHRFVGPGWGEQP